jgi:hypothetical protein
MRQHVSPKDDVHQAIDVATIFDIRLGHAQQRSDGRQFVQDLTLHFIGQIVERDLEIASHPDTTCILVSIVSLKDAFRHFFPENKQMPM